MKKEIFACRPIQVSPLHILRMRPEERRKSLIGVENMTN